MRQRNSRQFTKAAMIGLMAAVFVRVFLPGHADAADRDFTDAELTSGFMKTVFGLEYPAYGGSDSYVKRFIDPVRVSIINHARRDRTRDVKRFLRTLPHRIHDLDLRVVNMPGSANFIVHVVDRRQYADIVRNVVYQNPTAPVRGRCMVRVLSTEQGISSAQAVIVSDEGSFMFKRCMVEEILQGLGPLNDDASLYWSVFNDSSRHNAFMRHDQFILNMLYHPAMRPGLTRSQALHLLPRVIAASRQHVD